MAATTTLDLDWSGDALARGEEPRPGVVLVLLAGVPVCAAEPLGPGGVLELGRGQPFGRLRLDDGWMSRQHVRVRRRLDGWEVADVGSRNGTAVDGVVLEDPVRVKAGPRLVRAGTSLFLLRDDIRPFQSMPVDVSASMVMGPVLGGVFGDIARASRFGDSLHIVGESGVGKELAARAFHQFGPRADGPFVAVNCAAIPEGVAERLLFGARKGAYSGADAHAEGYVQAAAGGTLFLDEIAELDLAVQAKLLRVLENREVLALGAARAVPVELHICSATHRDLRVEAAAGRIREDLYFRLSRPEVVVPPLRDRVEEIPLLVARALRDLPGELSAHASLVETCMLRAWPGNVRELIAEVRSAGQAAAGEELQVVEERHLPDDAGRPLGATQEQAAARPGRGQPTREAIEAVLRAEAGNVSSSARLLGLHRTQLRRLMARFGLEARDFSPDGD
ncbi:MAG: sigma 54-interacting transcriptional regulator [Myxococcales bacterium]|nr:sigma 54-interacting transcriptional regulator [Myxococcales bacterium]